uniref:Autophagy-related protein 13 n=1 Tax=Syphacia muris TaxID=451379 RepID=A0A0N5AGD0_9BILA
MKRHEVDHAKTPSGYSGIVIPRRLSEISNTVSEQSSSLRLQWDDLNWETRSDLIGQGAVRRCQSLSPSDVSDFSEFQAARKLFDDITTISFDEHLGVDEGYMDATPTGEGSFSSISDTHEFIEKNCMTDSKHLYKIVTGCSPGSDSFSVNSNMTSRSFQSLRQCAASTSLSNGLLDLTSPTSASVGDGFSNSMTDSAISRGSTSTGDDRLNNTSLNDFNGSVSCNSRTDDYDKVDPCAESYCATSISKKKNDSIFADDRRLCILRRSDLYDQGVFGVSHTGNSFKRSAFFVNRIPESSILYEDCEENESLKRGNNFSGSLKLLNATLRKLFNTLVKEYVVEFILF